MGVPKFFRWAGDRYPAIVSGIITEKSAEQRQAELQEGTGKGHAHPPSTVPPTDNLYLDMNGIIHNCSHSNNQTVNAALTAEEVLVKMIDFIEYLVTQIVVPQKLLYMAIDGVAPRAKLNQQRARRFRAAKSLELSLEQMKQETGKVVDNAFDSNCITPGTEFMTKISQGMQRFVLDRQANSPDHSVWKKIQVIFSGGEVPGEGEHKIMQYIRSEKAHKRMPANTRHCIYGADADMIMLALATHEPHVVIIREILEFTKDGMKDGFTGKAPAPQNEEADEKKPEKKKDERKKMQYIRVNILREYLYREFCAENAVIEGFGDEERAIERQTGRDRAREREIAEIAFAEFGGNKPGSKPKKGHQEANWDIERVIDDFIFLTFLIGNDFLPHLPGLDIGDDAFEIIFDAYKNTMNDHAPSYLINNAEICDLIRLQTIFEIIGQAESVVFTEKATMESIRKEKMRRREQFKEGEKRVRDDAPHHGHEKGNHGNHGNQKESHKNDRERRHDKEAATQDEEPDVQSENLDEADLRRAYYARKLNLVVDDEAEKFILEENLDKPRLSLDDLAHEYLLGLAWNLKYYTEGCASWGWYYPQHYGPFLQDMFHLGRYVTRPHIFLTPNTQVAQDDHVVLNLNWIQGEPLTPFEQLLACLPPRSANLLPDPYSFLMNDPRSPILEYYPKDFKTDLNGKKNDYEAVVLLPFIDATRLLEAESQHVNLSALPDEVQKRNTFGNYHVYDVATGDKEFPPVIAHGVGFKPELTAGTRNSLLFWPSLAEILSASHSLENRDFFGKTVYVSGGGGGRGGRGGRGDHGRGGRGDHGRGDHGRGSGRGHHNQGGFPMPGSVPEPSYN